MNAEPYTVERLREMMADASPIIRETSTVMWAANELDRRAAWCAKLAARITKLEAAGKRLRRAHEYAENFVIRRGETLLDFAAGENWDNALNPQEPTP